MSDYRLELIENAYGNVPEIIPATREAIDNYAEAGYGQDVTVLMAKQLSALKAGKALAFSDGEYTHIIVLHPDVGDV